MFGLFKKLFSKKASEAPTAVPLTEKPPLPPAPAVARKPMASAPAPSPNSSVPAPAAATSPAPAPRQVNGKIELPLNEILTRLPNDMAAQVLSPPGVMFSLSTGVALEQLRTGAVRIPFSQLRQGSPPGTFAPNGAHDDALIDLPLSLVLAALGPAGLARRPDQKRTVVPEEVTGVFGAKQSQFNHTAPKVATPLQSRPASVVEKEKPQEAAAVMPSPVLPKPASPAVALPTPAKPAAPAFKPTPAPAPAAKAPSPLPFASARPAPPPAAAPTPSGGTVVVNIEAVCSAWPDPVRQEIQQSDLGIAAISIPVNRLEPGMKSGRVVFTWAELRGWLNSPVPPSPHGESSLELPLKVMAPLFLAKKAPPAPRKVVMGGEDLPDLFGGVTRPPAAAPELVAPSPPAPVAAPHVMEELVAQPTKTDWTPQEIAQRILSLPGVAGAVLASNDGLRVAGQLPAPMNSETMAAFLPRIFTQTVHCAGEVQLGTLRALRLSAGPAPCVICKVGSLFLAVLGQQGQTLPEAALEQLTVELSQHNN